MKKMMLTCFAVTSFFLCLMVTHATTLNRESSSNGEVKLSLTVDEGYVGGIDVTLKISGDVTYSNFTWDTSFSKYVKKNIYNENNKELSLYVATGSTSKNLANDKRNIPLGTMKVSSSKDTKYNITVSKLVLTDMDYKYITKTDVTNNPDSELTFKKTNSSNSNSNSSSNSNSNSNSSSSGNSSSGSGSSSSGGTSSGTTSNSSSTQSTGSTSSNAMSSNSSLNNDTLDDQTSNTSKDDTITSNSNKEIAESTKEEKDKKSNSNAIAIVSFCILVVVAACLILWRSITKTK